MTTGLPGLAWAEGYGWTGVSFRYEALSEFLGGKAGSDAANLARVTASVREVLRQQYSEAEAADYLETLRSMMTEGWESAPDRDTKAQQWLVVHIILEYGLLSEFRAESLSKKRSILIRCIGGAGSRPVGNPRYSICSSTGETGESRVRIPIVCTIKADSPESHGRAPV